MTDLKKVIPVRIDDLIEPTTNPNVMSADDLERLVQAIKRFGFAQPILARPEGDGKYRIVDGVHRSRAARKAGLTEVLVAVGDFSADEATALQIGMNKLRGELDLGGVAEALSALLESGWTADELTLTGFAADEVESLITSLKPENPEDLFTSSTTDPSDSGEKEPSEEFLLSIAFADPKSLRSARRKLKKLGGGDLRIGLEVLLDGAS